MRRLLTIQYLGTRYAGWQAQSNATGVQQVVESALSTLFQETIRIEGAGRTDSGVHALAQRAHVDVPRDIAPRGFILGVNNLLPHDIRVTAVEPVDDTFHCRFAAKSKTYLYRIWNAPVADVFTFETHAHLAQPLDEVLMNDIAQVLVGTHDFRSFTVAEPEVSSTTRTISELSIRRSGDVVELRVSADGFLRYMVRRIAGSLMEIGRGRNAPETLARTLAPEFHEARWTAPAKGLVLFDIRY